MSCNYNVKAKIGFSGLLNRLNNNNATVSEKLTAAIDFIKNVKSKAVCDQVSNIDEYLKDIEGELSNYFNIALNKYGAFTIPELTIHGLIFNPETTDTTDILTKAKTLESLQEEVDDVNELRNTALEKLWGNADSVRTPAMKKISSELKKNFLFDLDSELYIHTIGELNAQIKKHKNQLFKSIFDYLKDYYKTKSHQISNVDYSVFDNYQALYDEDGNVTDIFNQVYHIAQNHFNNFSTSRLLSNAKLNKKANDVFANWNELTHFNEFVKLILGDNVVIKNINRRFHEEYAISKKAADFAWNNSEDDDIDVSESVNKISKLIVETVDLYDWKSGQKIANSYVNFNLFINVITELKKLAWDLKLSRNFMLNGRNGYGAYNLPLENLNVSQETVNYIRNLGENATLATLLNTAEDNPQESYSAIFELLANPRLIQDLLANDSSKEYGKRLENIIKLFNPELLNVLLSLYKGLYSYDRGSLHAMLLRENWDSDINYYQFITQTTGSIWFAKNAQFFMNPDTKEVIFRELKSNDLFNMQLNLKDLININNSYTTNDWESKPLESNPELRKYPAMTYSKTYGFSYNYNGHTINFNDVNGGKFTIDLNDPHNMSLDAIKELALPIIDDVLLQDLRNNIDYYNIITSQFNSEQEALISLFKFCTEIMHHQYAAKHIKTDIINNGRSVTDSEILTNIRNYFNSTYYNTAIPKVIFDYGTIDLVPTKMITEVLSKLATAKAIFEGAMMNNLATDSEGKSIADSTQSRLLSKVQNQFERIRIAEQNGANPPAGLFDLLQDPYLLEDIFTVRDFKNSEDTKLYKDFSEREFLESAVLYNLLGPLYNEKQSSALLSDSKIAMLASVNSDKNTIANMITNGNRIALKFGKPDLISVFKEVPTSQIINYINSQLGTYYSRLVAKLQKDLTNIENTYIWNDFFHDYKAVHQAEWNNFRFKYNPKSYRDFNSLFASVNMHNATRGLPTYSDARDFFDAISRESGIQMREPILFNFINGGRNIEINNSIFALNARHNNDIATIKEYFLPTMQGFVNNKNVELLAAFVKSRADIDLTESSAVNDKFKKDFPDWVARSGQMTIAKIVKKSGEIVEVVNALLLELLAEEFAQVDAETLEVVMPDFINDPHLLLHYFGKNNIQINPVLEKYNLLQYCYSLEYLLGSVGSHVNHPKGLTIEIPNPDVKYTPNLQYAIAQKYLHDESDKYQALHKRNVSQTASMHEFEKNQLNGIPSSYNIAVIEDINDLTYNILGKTSKQKPFDGATFVDPMTVMLENNSLGAEAAGTHKKQFVHFYDNQTGTGGIIKTAGFGITNMWMRDSEFIERMNKNMMNHIWTGEDGNPVELDITQTCQNGMFFGTTKIPELYFSDSSTGERRYFKIKHIDNIGPNTYRRTLVEVDKHGVEISEEYTENDENIPQVIFTDVNSNWKVWNMLGGKDSWSYDKDSLTLSCDTSKGYGEDSIKVLVDIANHVGFAKNANPRGLKDYYQPMKHSNTHYLVTEGALKQGTNNFNKKGYYYKDDGFYNRFTIDIYLAGIQLDKEHHADNSKISMMTQVISACAELGYSWDESNKLYLALASLARQGVKPIADTLGVKGEDTGLVKIIVKSLANGSKSKDGVIYNIAYKLIEKYKNGEEITDKDVKDNPIAIDDPAIFDKLQSQLSSLLTKASIKLKFDGILSVLVPSHETMKLYDGKLRSKYINFEREIAERQRNVQPVTKADVQIGRVYRVFNPNTGVEEDIMVQAPYMTDKDRQNVYGNPDLKYVAYYDLDQYEFETGTGKTALFTELLRYGRNLGAYHASFTDSFGNNYSFYELQSVYNLYHNIGDEEANRKLVTDDLKNLKEGGSVLLRNGNLIRIASVNITPYELIMTKTMADKFNLTSDDDISELQKSPLAWREKLVNNLGLGDIPEDAYDFAMKNVNGKHVYVMDSHHASRNRSLKAQDSYPNIIDPMGGIWRVDAFGNKIQELASENDQIYEINGKEVIVTDNPEWYLEHTRFNTIELSTNINDSEGLLDKIITASENTSNPSFSAWYRDCTRFNQESGRREFEKDKLVELTKNVHGYALQNALTRNANQLYTSFKKSLDVIAARIPAQGMQSFMPMKVVGFDESGVNNAYVSTHLIWLQGSDYDIDCVSLLTYEFGRNGAFIGWSPYFDLSSEESLKISEQLNYPTGEKVSEFNIRKMPELAQREEGDSDFDYFQTNIDKYVNIVFGCLTATHFNKNGNIRINLTMKPGMLREFVNMINFVSEQGLLELSSQRVRSMILDSIKAIYGNDTFDDSDLDLFYDSIKTIVNKHNDYINSNQVESFTKNFVVQLMYTIGMTPVNLISAQVSVDATTAELKRIANESTSGKALTWATPGNFANMYQSIEDNHVGKDVIGISAVGLKTFFALFQYINSELQKGNLEILLHPIEFNGKTYYTISGAKYSGENAQILQALSEMSEKDAALSISALLSLATDNAKELCLAKLNATPEMAGMYIYGLTMGINFRELGRLLMGDVGNTVATYLKGSIISDKLKLNSVGKVISFLNDPVKTLRDIGYSRKVVMINSDSNAWSRLLSIYPEAAKRILASSGKDSKVYEFLNKKIHNKHGADIALYEDFNTLISTMFTDLKSGDVTESTLMKILDDITKYSSQGILPQMYQMIDLIKDTIHSINKVYKSGRFDDFKTLYLGAEEMKAAGLILGSNQGVKNGTSDYIKFIYNVENAIDTMVTARKNCGEVVDDIDTEVDFSILSEPQTSADGKKLQEYIDAYGSIMQSFNIYNMLLQVPHYKAYMEVINKLHRKNLERSMKYRMLYSNLRRVPGLVGYIKFEKLVRSMELLIDDKLINIYLAEKTFALPADQEIIAISNDDLSEIRHRTNKTAVIHLGNPGGNATFINWMEQEVIPNLKMGYSDSKRQKKIASIAQNLFAIKLRPNLYTKNPNKRASRSYYLGMNTSPNAKLAQARYNLDTLIAAFDELNKNYTVIDELGRETSIPIKDLFYWYNLTTYSGKGGQATLTNVFDNYITSAEPAKFRQILKDLGDDSNYTLPLSDFEIALATAQIGSPYSSTAQYIYVQDRSSLKVEFMSKLDDRDERTGKLYDKSFFSLKASQDLVKRTPIKGDIFKLDLDGASVTYNDVTRNIREIIDFDGNKIPVSELNMLNEHELFTVFNGLSNEYELDPDLITQYLMLKRCSSV